MIGPNLLGDFKKVCIMIYPAVDGYTAMLSGIRTNGRDFEAIGGCGSDTMEGALSKCKTWALKKGLITG